MNMSKKEIPDFTQNRELSWLRFNQRVLEEARDESVPLMERMKFVAIFTSNLDEFFMIRVGSLYDLAATDDKKIDQRSGMRFIVRFLRFIRNGIRLMRRLKSSFIPMVCVGWISKNWSSRKRNL